MTRPPWPAVRVTATQPRLDGALCVAERAGLAADCWAPGADPEDAVTALVICQRCPVLAACRTWTLTTLPSDVGVQGGYTRASLRAARKRDGLARSGLMPGFLP